MMNKSSLYVIDPNGTQSPIDVYYSKSPPWTVSATVDECPVEFVDRDLFDALKKLRLLLERSGKILMCNGARIDAYPSGMNREAGGKRLYIHPADRNTRLHDLVNTFDAAPADRVGTVAQQEEFWAGVLKKYELLNQATSPPENHE